MTIPATLVSVTNINSNKVNLHMDYASPVNIERDTVFRQCPNCGAILGKKGEETIQCDNCGYEDISNIYRSSVSNLMRAVDSARAYFNKLKCNLASVIPETISSNNRQDMDDLFAIVTAA